MDIVKKIAYVFTRRQKIGMVVLFIVIVIGALLELAGVTIILPFVNAVMDASYIMENEMASYVYHLLGMTSAKQFIILISIVLIIIFTLKNFFIIFMTNMQYRYMYNYQRKLAEKMLSCYIKQPYLYHLEHGSTEMIRNVDGDVRSFFAVVISALQVLTEVCVCLVLISFLLYKDKTITIGICLVMLVFMASYMLYIRGKVSIMGEETRKYLHNINQGIVQSFSGIKEVKILNREKYFINNFKTNYKKYADYQTLYFVYGILPRPLMETVCVAGLLAVIVLKLNNGTVAAYFIPTISVFAIGAFRMMPSFSRIANNMNNIVFNMPAVNAIYQELKGMEELVRNMEQEAEDVRSLVFEEAISISNLDFRYPNIDKYVLQDSSLTIPKNKSVAFVGPSGEGKTTLADIILGLLKPERGSVFVDGVDVHQNIASWHRKLGYIPQAIYLTDDSIKNNIAFGLPDEEIDAGPCNIELKKSYSVLHLAKTRVSQ